MSYDSVHSKSLDSNVLFTLQTIHYIELLLDGNKDLASCLVSFLPTISNPNVNEEVDKNILTVNKR